MGTSSGSSAGSPVRSAIGVRLTLTTLGPLDIASIQTNKRQSYVLYEVAVTGAQREDRHPYVYPRIDIVNEFEGPDLRRRSAGDRSPRDA